MLRGRISSSRLTQGYHNAYNCKIYMKYDIQLPLPKEWTSEIDSYIDESGTEITHFEAHLPGNGKSREVAMIDIYVGDMPEDETAEDQAFANYAETVGFDRDDPEDYNPIVKVKFNGKNAWGFEAICEDDSPMRFLAQEVRSGVLAIIVFAGKDDSTVINVRTLIERNFRVVR